MFNWKDKRNVITVSTVPEHDASLVEVRDKKIKKPKSVLDYNRTKKGVDISDQMYSYYTALKKTNKWYKKPLKSLQGVPR